MFFNQIHQLFSFKRLLRLLIGLAIGIQVIVISYNHFSGYYPLNGLEHFFLRLLRGSILSLLAGFLIAYPDLYIIRYLNEKYPWGQKILQRLSIQLSFSVVLAVMVSIVITLFAHSLKAYTEPLHNVIINNALIYSVVNITMMAILEGWIFYIESRKSTEMAENLRQELSQIKFEVLKSQINPHFMFNSLNVLSSLINKDTGKAQQFIDEFSQVYRYVLETIEQPVATLGKELDFTRSYIFLQKIRYGENLRFTVDIPAALLKFMLPPLSLQVVLENAIKHNIVNEDKPLLIQIFNEAQTLIVKNNIQLKISLAKSTGLGLKNLSKRYSLITGEVPVFKVENDFYIARLPLLNTE